jgi:hypothetical protein
MRTLLLAAAAAAALATPAAAAITTLTGVTTNAPNDFTFTYQATLGPDEGVRSGDRLIIYDFNGYIDGSIFTPSANVIATTELSSGNSIVTPGFDDNPDVVNLVFTYVGPDMRNTSGPFAPFDLDGLGARSTFVGRVADAFFTLTTKNNPNGTPGGSNTRLYTLGSVAVPAVLPVPEPSSWAMMLGGFGLAGMALRRRSRKTFATA